MTKSFTILLTYILLGGFVSSTFAQGSESDKKIVISNKEEVYTYEYNKNGEVQINAEYAVTYRSIKPSTISFAEYYDDDSEIKKVKIKGIKGVSPKYGMYKQENIFFSDNKACYFNIPFVQKDSEATVTLTKLYKDIRRFIFLPLAEYQHTDSRTIRIITPDWINIDVVGNNLSENITVRSMKDETKKTSTTIINITNQPEYIHEENSPEYMHSQPYISIIPKESSNKDGDTIRYFKTTDDLYQWSKRPLELMDNNLSIIKKKASELTKDCISDDQKIRELYKWVQQNIRYIAFLDGISGFKPDNAQDVITKKYGDCKGMSNLLKLLLQSEGFDARLAWVATADAARDLNVSHPIPFANHMICGLYRNDSLYYLDPTVKSLVLGETPEQLQGQTALIENGVKYTLAQIPKYGADYNRDSLFIQYSIKENRMKGKASRSFRGESKHSLSYWINNLAETKIKTETEKFLKNGEIEDSIFEIDTKELNSFSPQIGIKYKINKKSNISIFSNKFFINLDETKDYQNAKIDIDKRKTALKHPYRDHTVRVTELLIPEGYDTPQLPAELKINREKYSFLINYSQENNKIIYHKQIFIFNPILEKTDFEQWNSDIDTLRKAYGELIVLEKNNVE